MKGKKFCFKKLFLIFLMIGIISASAFAQSQGAIGQLDEWGKKIVSLFTSTWLKAICIISLIGICIGMITVGRSEQGMMKKFVPWLVGVIILLSASSIVNYFFQGANLDEGLGLLLINTVRGVYYG